jgi:hypothetical protein
VLAEEAMGRKAQRRADVALVVAYHEARLAELLERVREGFPRYDAGELNAFELDDLIHRYKRAARELWKYCGDLSGARTRSTARMLEDMQARGETVDWWEQGNPRRD